MSKLLEEIQNIKEEMSIGTHIVKRMDDEKFQVFFKKNIDWNKGSYDSELILEGNSQNVVNYLARRGYDY